MQECTGMKKRNTHTFFPRWFLGIFLGILLFSSGGVRAGEDCTTKTDFNQCTQISYCTWVKSYMKGDGTVTGACFPNAQNCWNANKESMGTRQNTCEALDCAPWDAENPACKPKDICEGKKFRQCGALSATCTWKPGFWSIFSDESGACTLKSPIDSAQAVALLDGVCHCLCKTEKDGCKNGKTKTLIQSDCVTTTNEFWAEEMPDPCEPPLIRQEIDSFCNNHAALLSEYGKTQCRAAIQLGQQAIIQECLDDVEATYQQSLKDETAREALRIGQAACTDNADAYYPGAIFSGEGLRSGAVIAHQKLTKSISHQTDLKTLILDWTRFALELVAIIAVVAVIWAGVLYITDMGDGSNQEKAKKILLWVVIGILLILGSYAIVNTLMSADFTKSVHVFNSFFV